MLPIEGSAHVALAKSVPQNSTQQSQQARGVDPEPKGFVLYIRPFGALVENHVEMKIENEHQYESNDGTQEQT